MKKKTWLWVFAVIFVIILVVGSLSEEPVVEETVVETLEPEPVEVVEQTDAERLGVTEKVLSEIEHVMSVAGWEYTREDFERIYRLKEDEMALNPAVYAQYEVTVRDGQTHDLTLRLDLIEG